MLTHRHQNILFEFLTQPRFRIWRHLLFLIIFFPIGLTQAFFVFDGHTGISTNSIYGFGTGLAVTIIGFVYFNIYFLAVRFLSRGEYASYIIALLLSVSGFVFIKYTAEYWIFSNAGIYRGFNAVSVLDGLSNLMLYAICIASGSITLLFKQLIADHAQIENLENKQLKTSIDEIKNRINPRFLYTTLDYAFEKVKSDPEQTSDTLFKLSELLRYQLYDCTRDKVLLKSDIEFIRNYLLLVQQNSKNSFSYTVSVSGDTTKFISHALFMPWIEEIIRQRPTGLFIQFVVDDCSIKFKCAVSGIDLSRCDFKKAEQKPILLYGNDIAINKGADSITLQLKIC